MDQLRKLHNNCKREFIKQWVRPGSHVLDCGCGRGGDFNKWKAVNARVDAIDPDEESLVEAKRRSDGSINFLGLGDIRHVTGQWDVVCYNFSIHYIFSDETTLNESIDAISRAVRPGGLLIGIAPEKIRIQTMCHPNGIFQDSLGNKIKNLKSHASVQLVDGPFYNGEWKEEPYMDNHILISKLKFRLVSWEPMMLTPNGLISDMYTKFVFCNDRDVDVHSRNSMGRKPFRTS